MLLARQGRAVVSSYYVILGEENVLLYCLLLTVPE